jgi:two-component system, cell cycle sensor histidine kinase and response regulator CckA
MPIKLTESSQTDLSQSNALRILRRLSEKFLEELKFGTPRPQKALYSEYTPSIIKELQTHQIELEMQIAKLCQTQVELESERALYFNLFDLAPVGYCTVCEKGIILETNLTAANLLGVTRGVLLNKPFSRFVLEEDQGIFSLLRKQLIETGHSQSGELRLIRQDKTSFWANLETTVELNENRMSVSRIVLCDIAKRKCAEEALQKEYKQDQSVRRQLHKAESLERMAAAITHLFNNHLQVALGNLEMAQFSLATNAEAQKNVTNAIQALCKSADVSGLLRTYLGQDISKLESLDLSQNCQRSLLGIEPAVPSGINIKTNLMSPGPVVNANASQMQQVMAILITNACEAIGDLTGEVTVAIKTVPATILPNTHISDIVCVNNTSDAFACLEVTDSGCGMSNEEMGKIFDPFYTTKFTGRGLSLAVARSLIRAWGGMIKVNSEIHVGSCFKVLLPLAADGGPQQAEPLTEQKIFKAEGTVLLVDDDLALCNIGKGLLKHLGFTVFIATSGYEAVALFEKYHNSIDCLLTDLSMPGMDGWETLTALRKIKPDLPVILSSGYDEAQVMKGDHAELPQAFLHKPYTKDNLQNILNQVLGDATKGDN